MNEHIVERLHAIYQMLCANRDGGARMSSASKGTEREVFLDKYLREAFRPDLRFGNGDATDQDGNSSGQLDIVIEYPLVVSLPAFPGGDAPRLYLAEGIAAAIEVKSDVLGQWDEVMRKAERIAKLRRDLRFPLSIGDFPYRNRIPFFVVGYTGWHNIESLKTHLAPGMVDAILVIDQGLFASVNSLGSVRATGPAAALWAFLCCLHKVTGPPWYLMPDIPMEYALRDRAQDLPVVSYYDTCPETQDCDFDICTCSTDDDLGENDR